MAYILIIETATLGCSVSVQEDFKVLSSAQIFQEKKSATMLTTLISQCVDNAGLLLSDINAIAVSKGPGSYTGLRVGVSTAKGLCLALNIPLISYNTLEGMTFQIQNDKGLYLCPMIDAMRDEVYCLIKKDNKILQNTEALILEKNSFKEYLDLGPTLFFGSGAKKTKEIIEHKNACFLSQEIVPNALFLNEHVYSKYLRGEFEDLVEFEPYYLKEFLVKKPKKNAI